MTAHAHDKFFRFIASQREHAIALARLVLPPQIAELVDFSRLRVAQGRMVNDALRERIADLVFTLPFLSGGECIVDLVVEHQSTNDRWMAPRSFHLVGERWTAWLKDNPGADALPMVLTVVVSHAPGGWRAPRDVCQILALDNEQRSRFAEYLPSAPYHVFDLSAVDDAVVRAAAETASVELMLLCFRYARDVESLRRVLPIRAELIGITSRRHDGKSTIMALLRYIANLGYDFEDEEDLYTTVHAACIPEVAEVIEMEGFAVFVEKHGQRWRDAFGEQMHAKGVEEGIEQGSLHGQRMMLTETIRRRFRLRELPARLRERIALAEADELSALLDRALTAEQVSDVIPPA